jgi:hypothetical protein
VDTELSWSDLLVRTPRRSDDSNSGATVRHFFPATDCIASESRLQHLMHADTSLAERLATQGARPWALQIQKRRLPRSWANRSK